MFDLSGLYQVLPDEAQPVPVPLVGVEVRAVVRNFIAEVELSQKYQNKDKNPPEDELSLKLLSSLPSGGQI